MPTTTTTEETRGRETQPYKPTPPNGHSTRRTPRHLEEQVAALTLTTDMSVREIAEVVGLAPSTVFTIQKRVRREDEETFAQLRTLQKREWVRKAWDAVEHLTLAAVKGAEKLARDDADLTARDVRDLTVAAGIMVDKTALVLGEAGSGASGGQTREIADAVLGAWQAGREEGRREASPVNVTPQNVIDGAAEVR